MKAWTRYISATLFSIIGAGIYGFTWAGAHGGGSVGDMVLIVLFFMMLFLLSLIYATLFLEPSLQRSSTLC